MAKLRSKQCVTYEKAKTVLRLWFNQLPLEQRIRLFRASELADVIWPEHEMTAQGAGGAASRILHRLQEEGFAYWTVDDHSWGWRLKFGSR